MIVNVDDSENCDEIQPVENQQEEKGQIVEDNALKF